ncbi:MAG: SOS response-associated peptidase [Gemmatimonadetes bacterium]|nr:SOS response-associated peptidase [Gemmatimonadota bacterium]
MCGRFGLTRPDQLRLERLGLSLVAPAEPHFNVAPGHEVLTVRETGGKREATLLRWGIHPHWGSQGQAIVNVRSEGGFHQGPFRHALHLRRCLVFCDVFYEWQAVPGRRRKQPWAIARPGRAPFALGAVWEPASSGEEVAAAALAVLTTEPNALIRPLHDRMPVIVAEDRWVDWLDAHTAEPAVQEMTMPWPSEELVAWPISERVNVVAHDDAAILEPVDARPEELELF